MEKKAGWRNHGGMAWHNITKQREREKANTKSFAQNGTRQYIILLDICLLCWLVG